jgi:hypothetical protein
MWKAVSEGRISIPKTRFGENNYEFGESKFEEHARGRGTEIRRRLWRGQLWATKYIMSVPPLSHQNIFFALTDLPTLFAIKFAFTGLFTDLVAVDALQSAVDASEAQLQASEHSPIPLSLTDDASILLTTKEADWTFYKLRIRAQRGRLHGGSCRGAYASSGSPRGEQWQLSFAASCPSSTPGLGGTRCWTHAFQQAEFVLSFLVSHSLLFRALRGRLSWQ